jgi:nucleotide-binding universal stress UspA family protein
MYNTILVPLDGSKRAEMILPYVEDIARLRNSTLIFLQVIDPSVLMAAPHDLPYYDAALAARWIEEAEAYLAGLQSEFREKGLAVKVFVEQGPVVHTILEVAQREKADLIAIASHGRTGLARVFYGSVAAGVLQRADRPLLLIRALEE